MTAQSILDDLLSHVVLWDVKAETSYCIIPSLYSNIEEEIDYLKQHGYNAKKEGEFQIIVSRN